MTGVLAMALGMAAGAGLAGDSGGFSRRPDMPDVVPVMVYPDGGWIGRIVNKEGFISTVLPMWHRGSDHWTAPDQLNLKWKDVPIFVYVAANDQTEGVIYVSHTYRDLKGLPTNIMVFKLGGLGLGPILGAARNRILGFLYGTLLPESDNPITALARPKLASPTVVPLEFKRGAVRTVDPIQTMMCMKQSKTGSGLKIRTLLKRPDPSLDKLLKAATYLVENKFLSPWGWEDLSVDRSWMWSGLPSGIQDESIRFLSYEPKTYNAPLGTVRIGVALHYPVARKPPPPTVWETFRRDYDSALTPEQRQVFRVREQAGKQPPLWTIYLYPTGLKGGDWGHTNPITFLGASDIGPFEAMLAAEFFIAETKLEGWLDTHADFTGVRHPGLEVYDLLDEPTPLLWDTSAFIVWAQGQEGAF